MTPSKFMPSMLALLALSACAHTPSEPTSFLRPSAMTTPLGAADAQNPKLSVEEIGKRFLKLIEGLKSRDDLSVERVQDATGLKLVSSEGGYGYEGDLGGGWRSVLNYRPESLSSKEGVDLHFVKEAERFADMTPVCTLDFEYYHNALKAMGFIDDPSYGEIGQLIAWHYTKFAEDGSGGDITISIIPQNVVAGTSGRLCVKSIGTLN